VIKHRRWQCDWIKDSSRTINGLAGAISTGCETQVGIATPVGCAPAAVGRNVFVRYAVWQIEDDDLGDRGGTLLLTHVFVTCTGLAGRTNSA
jgi:hypothetical protein